MSNTLFYRIQTYHPNRIMIQSSMTRNTDGRIPITEEMIATLHSYKEKTGWGITSLFGHMKRQGILEKKSNHFTAAAVHGWLYRTTNTILQDDYHKVITAYESLTPDMWHKSHALNRRKARMPVSDGFRVRLNKMLNECTISRTQLLKYYAAPFELNSSKLGSIANGKIETISLGHFEFLEKLIEVRMSEKPEKKQ